MRSLPRPRRTVACAVLAALCTRALTAQQPQPQRPTFSSAVDLVSVDVTIIDPNGRPIGDLNAGDFILTVDGRPRNIVSAQFVSATVPAEAPTPASPAAAPEYTTNVGGPPGRLIAIVADRGSIAPIRSKDVFAAAARFVEGLAPTDRIGLFSIPDGPNIDFTTGHDRIIEALQRMDGTAHASSAVKYVSVAEALEFERNNTVVIETVMRRECGVTVTSARGVTGAGETAICMRLVQDEAPIVAQYAHERARDTVKGLSGILQRLGSSETPKTLVLISEGLVVDGERFLTNGLGRLLAATHATVYALKPEPSDSDASQPRAPQNRAQERSVLETGLSIVTTLSGGEMFRIVANPDYSFKRLASELSGYYLLGFAPEASDRDGKQHRITVSVRRSGVQVRSRTEFMVEPATRANAEQVVAGLLRSPAFATGVPFKLTTYAFQDPDSIKIRLLVAIEVDRTDGSGDMALGLALIKSDGEMGPTFYQPSIDAPTEGTTQTCFATLVVEPGPYTLKAAVVDAKGRRGSLERPVRAFMTRMAQFRATQLMIGDGEAQAPTANTIVPTVTGALAGAQLHAYMELVADTPESFAGASVRLEILPEGGTTVVDAAEAVLQPTGRDPRVRAAAGSLKISLLPRGRYVARAIVAVNGKAVGDMTRAFAIGKP